MLANVSKNGDHNVMKAVYNPQSGNVLWLILLGIAMLGFLTTMVSRNSSSVNQSGDVEKARIKASALLRYTASIEGAVQRLLLNGVSENDLDFVSLGGAYDNTNCSSDDCNVFAQAGGGVAYRPANVVLGQESLSIAWHIDTENRIYQMGCDDSNNGCTELLLLLKDIPEDICLQVNKINGIENPSGAAPQLEDIEDTAPYTGPYSATINTVAIGGTNATNEAPQLRGHAAGCFYEFGSAQNKYHFYQMLIAR